MNKDLIAVFEYLEREKGIRREVIIDAIHASLEQAAKKSVHEAHNVSVSIDPRTGAIDVFCDKEVVAKVEHPIREISFKDALEIDADIQLGDVIEVAITPKDFGRIAAQKARQIISQKLRGAERDVIYEEYRYREGELISGTIKKIGRSNTLIVDLGKVEGVIPPRNYPKTEKYHVGERVLALLSEVRDTEDGGAEVVLSRNHPDFVRQLFIQEVPEVSDGTIEIEKIVRDAGYRTKMIVHSPDPKIDPVGSCIGMRGTRVKNVSRELGGEKIDIIPFSEDLYTLLENAIKPIEIRYARLDGEGEELFLVVDDENFPKALGQKGKNVRLLSLLFDVRIDLHKYSDFQKIKVIERANLAVAEDPRLDQPLTEIEGVSSLIIDQLVHEGLQTPRDVLQADSEKLEQLASAGITAEIVDKFIEQITKG